MRFFDLTKPLKESTVVYTGHEQFKSTQTRSIEPDGYNLTHFSMGAHCGTHMDAPAHFLGHAATIDQVPLELLVGEAFVVTRSDGEGFADLPKGTIRLIVRSDHFSGVTMEQAEEIIQKGVRLIGTDRLSVARDGWDAPVHRKLLGAGVWIVENLALDELPDGLCEFFCLPLRIEGCEGAPCRALARLP